MTLNRSLFFTTIGLLFAVLFVPLFVNNSLFFPFITGKNFAFRILVELATLAWVILMLRDKTYRPKITWLSIVVTAFVLIVGIADAFGSNPIKSFLSNFERMEGWITLAHLLAYFLVITCVLRTWTLWQRYFQASLVVSAIVCIYGFMQLAGTAAIHQSTSRLDASFGNATYLAVYMLFHVFIALILLVKRRKEPEAYMAWYKDVYVYVYGVMVIVQSMILFFTATRGSILGLIGGLIMSAILVAITERESKTVRKVAVGILVVIAALIGLFFLTKNTAFVQRNEVLSRFSSISLSDNTTKSRFFIWNMAWKGVTQDPKHFVIGWGQESFNYIFAQYYDPRMYAQEQWFDRSHDVVFDWLTQAGMLGLLAYLSIFGFTLFCTWKKSNFSRLEKSLITGLLAGYFFHNLFVFDNITSYILFFIILAYVDVFSLFAPAWGVTAVTAGTKTENEAKPISPAFQYAGMILAGALFIGIFYQYDYKPIVANLTLINSLTQTQVAAASADAQPSIVYTKDNVDNFKKVIAYNTIGLYEAREQLFEIAAKATSGSTDQSVKQDLVNLAETQIDQQLKETPNDVRYYVLGGVFYQNIGDLNHAQTLLAKAETLSPSKQSLLFVLGSNEFALKQYTDALAIFKKAYELDTTYDEAKKLYALVAVYVGQDKIASDLFGPGPIMDPRFLAAYKGTKQYDLMIAYLEKNAALNTSDLQAEIQAKVALAAGYVTINNRTKAVSTLLSIKTMTSDPSVATQIDTLVKAIKAGKNPFEAPITAATTTK
ncbi:TPA: hypothetical protein DCQ44_01690 [Candidatus Taylorbacteria bacterium]|nr:hypothetical protein [Candidatus Taylorbacteria bacterium]